MRNWTCLAILLFVSGFAVAGTLTEKWAKRVESADEIYQTAIKKADDTRFFAVRKAALEHVRLLKSALTDATKAGDFDAATELKARLDAAETADAARPKPKNTVKFGGHEYALIDEKVTWHIAKNRCEEMGGHLAIVDTPQKRAFLVPLAGDAYTWVGGSDAEKEGEWQWVDGRPIGDRSWIVFDQQDVNHYLLFDRRSGSWLDAISEHRSPFFCEWD